MADIIAGRKAISKFFYQYGFGEKLSSVPQKRLTEIICGLAMKGNQSRTTDFAELNQGFRTSYGHFLSKGKWDEQKVSQQQQTAALRKADELALISAFLIGKFFLIIPIDGTLRSCSSCKKCIWASNPSWFVPQKPSIACLSSCPWRIYFLSFFLTPPCLCLPLFAVSGPFCAVFNVCNMG